MIHFLMTLEFMDIVQLCTHTSGR